MALLEKSLIIKRSQIPKSGKGLFTKVAIKKGQRIVEYKGRLVKWKDVKYEDATNGYLLYITSQAVIDGRPSKTFGRYANDAHGYTRVKGLTNNAEYVCEGKRCFIEATRNIMPGAEIFVDYGKDYWKLDRETRKEAERKKKKAKK